MTYARLGKKRSALSALKATAQLDPKLSETERLSSVITDLGGWLESSGDQPRL